MPVIVACLPVPVVIVIVMVVVVGRRRSPTHAQLIASMIDWADAVNRAALDWIDERLGTHFVWNACSWLIPDVSSALERRARLGLARSGPFLARKLALLMSWMKTRPLRTQYEVDVGWPSRHLPSSTATGWCEQCRSSCLPPHP
jgi:hypothetical protein